jgi:hypothetical protein
MDSAGLTMQALWPTAPGVEQLDDEGAKAFARSTNAALADAIHRGSSAWRRCRSLSDRVPDARTIWLFREKLTRAEAIKPLFDRFEAALREAGYVAMGGQIVDASLIAAPKQRNTEEEKKAVKEGRIPEAWKAKPAKLRHKDRDAGRRAGVQIRRHQRPSSRTLSRTIVSSWSWRGRKR